MSARAFSQSWSRAVMEAQESAAHCGVTIAARLPLFFGCIVAPSGAALAEWNQACSEKVAATLEGAVAGAAEWQATMIRSAFHPPTPTGLADDMLRVMTKAAHPTRRRAKANAGRLSAERSAKRRNGA